MKWSTHDTSVAKTSQKRLKPFPVFLFERKSRKIRAKNCFSFRILIILIGNIQLTSLLTASSLIASTKTEPFFLECIWCPGKVSWMSTDVFRSQSAAQNQINLNTFCWSMNRLFLNISAKVFSSYTFFFRLREIFALKHHTQFFNFKFPIRLVRLFLSQTEHQIPNNSFFLTTSSLNLN